MEIISNCDFTDELVPLDGMHFINCNLEGCTLSYDGGAVIFERTRIVGCEYLFGGPAQRTADLLRVLRVLELPVWVNVQTEGYLQ